MSGITEKLIITNQLFKKKMPGFKAGVLSEKGSSLVESLVAVAIVAIALTALLSTLSAGSMAIIAVDQQVNAQSILSSQLEYVKGLSYDSVATTYDAVDIYDADTNPNPLTLPGGYVLTTAVSSIAGTDANIQKITITVSDSSGELQVMEGYKLKR